MLATTSPLPAVPGLNADPLRPVPDSPSIPVEATVLEAVTARYESEPPPVAAPLPDRLTKAEEVAQDAPTETATEVAKAAVASASDAVAEAAAPTPPPTAAPAHETIQAPSDFPPGTFRSQSASRFYAAGSPMEEVFRVATALARRESPVLLHGESGTGKEVLAHWLHTHSLRARGPFVAVNCAAITPSLVESELFGHCRGAFTHAVADRPGHIRQAHGGTLFLDEIGDMPLGLQARFLRVLQEKTVRPVGGDADVPVDFRLLCATHRDLFAEVRAGRFREDLYYRLRVLELRLPPLRQRPMDIPFLLRGFLESLLGAEDAEAAVESLPASALTYHFPGNVRELRNLAERHAALREIGGGWEQAMESCRHVTDLVRESEPEYVRASRTSRLTGGEVLAALEACGYHRGKAAKMLGVTRRTLQYHLARMKAGGEKKDGTRQNAEIREDAKGDHAL